MADQGHIETEKVLADIEREIYKEYSQAEKELADKIEDYFARFEKKKAIKLKALSEGKISQEEYDKWLIGQLAMGDRWKEMKETIAHDLGHASEMAMAISAGHMPEVYAINHDYGTFQVEKASLVDTSYTLYDRNTAKRLFEDEHQFYHDHGWKVGKHINEGKLIPWEKKQAQSVMTQALLQGESIGKIATRLQNAFGNSILEEDIKNRDKMTAEQIAKEIARRNRNASIRNARTMTTGVQNAGRVDSYKRADGMGIKLKQEWLATLDGRTRHEHRLLDGQRVAVGDKFVVDGYELEYPADPRGEAFLVYNCRCTLVPVLAGFEVDPSDTTLRHNAYLEEESYDEWKKNHASHSDPIDKQDRIAKKMAGAYAAEYRSYNNILNNVKPKPKTLSGIYVNANDGDYQDKILFENLGKVPPIDNYEDYGGHGTPNSFQHTSSNGQTSNYTAKEFADMLRGDPNYKGGNIRLLMCQTGADDDGFAQQLADELNVIVKAPTEKLWINEDGEIFITDFDYLAELWYYGEKVNQTGYMRKFIPNARR